MLENGNTNNAMTEVQFGRDGMVMEGPKEGPKDSFHKKTEKRWDMHILRASNNPRRYGMQSGQGRARV